MPTPRDSLSKLRTSVVRGRTGDRGAVYARARLKRAEITENYFVQQEISKNPWAKTDKPPTGRIELAVPYDGCDYFTREAREDVARGIAAHSQPDREAIIGHLLLQDYSKTSLRDSLHLPDRHGSVPIQVSVTDANGGFDDLDHLSADRQTCITTYEFGPEDPDVLPAELDITLYDPDSLDLPALDLAALDLRTEEGRRRLGDVISKIRQQVSFRDELVLHIVVKLNVPAKSDPGPLKARVARMAIDWPTITSLQTLSLRVGDGLVLPGAVVTFREAPVRYNPVEQRIEWEDVTMLAIPRSTGDDNVRHYQSVPMLLSIEHPGELYKQESLGAVAEVQISDYLLSGLTARVYDATGHISRAPVPTLTTKVCAAAELTLDDAFAKREFSPNQHLFFDEIIPDEMRITDIITALKDSGFDVNKIWPETPGPMYDSTSKTVNWLLVAQRQEGPDKMVLWIFVEGRHFETERETVMQGGGVTHKTKLQSGELRVFIRGTLPRDSRELTHEMNALQRTLRERYDRVRQRR
jgi:hypothetical protein